MSEAQRDEPERYDSLIEVRRAFFGPDIDTSAKLSRSAAPEPFAERLARDLLRRIAEEVRLGEGDQEHVDG